MAFVIADRVRETTTTTGTGAVTLAGAYISFQSFSAAIGNGNNTYYTIASATSGEWEVGIGTYTSASNTLSRDTILASSNAGSAVVFTAGTKDVFVTQPSKRSLLVQSSGTGLFAGNAAFTSGDILYANSTTTLANLGIGAANRVLTSSGTAPQWVTALTGLTGVSSSSITNTALTSGRVVYSTTGGLETDSANLTFDGTTLTANALTTTSTVTVNGGTANQVQYLNGSKVLTGSSNLTFDGTNLALTGSTRLIQLLSGAGIQMQNTAATANWFIATSSADLSFTSAQNGAAIWSINGSEQMRLNSTGLGIGNTSPTEKLDVTGNFKLSGSATLSGGTANGVLYLNGSKVATSGSALTYNGTNLINTAGYVSAATDFRLNNATFTRVAVADGGGGFVGGYNITYSSGVVYDSTGSIAGIYNSNGGNIQFFAGGSAAAGSAAPEGMRLTSTGLGIGTSSPSQKLQVVSASGGTTARFSNTNAGNFIDFYETNTSTRLGYIGTTDGTNWNIHNDKNGYLAFDTNNIERVRIAAAGNVTINAPSSGTALALSNAGGSNILSASDGTTTAVMVTAATRFQFGTSSAHSYDIITNNLQRVTITNAGNVTINAPSSGLESLTVNTLSGYGIRATAADLPRVATVSTGANAITVSMRSYDAGNFGIFGTQSNHYLNIRTNDVDRMIFDTSGNVGLGLTPSAWGSPFKALDMTASAFANEGTVAAHMTQNSYHNGTNWIYKATNLASRYLQYAGQHIWYNAPSGTAGNAITFTQAMTLNASGYLGIGTTNPLQPLVVSNGGAAGFEFVPASNIIQAYNRSTAAYTNLRFDCSQILFYTGTSPTESARIDSSGNLLVGTTTVFSASRVTIQGNATYAASILGTAGNTTSNCLFLGLGGNRSTDTTYSVINYVDTDGTGTARFRVYGNGNVVNTNNSYGSISDVKLKENIVDATPKLDKLLQVRVVNYNLIGEPDNKQLGVVAQELEQIFPAMVSQSPDLDADGNDLGTTTKSVKYSVFVPMLIKAMQEQQALIESLTARLNALENK